MKVFDLFVSKYPPGNDLRKPTAETLEQFQGKVPAELLNFWQEYGFGNYGGGLLKIIDPTDYIDTLTLWLGEQEGCLPILMTGFGTLFIYRKLSDTADDMCLLDIHNRRSGSFSTSFSDFFERIIPAENFAAQFLRVGLFQEAFAKHGGLSENEIFFFAPALAFGGTESIQYRINLSRLLTRWPRLSPPADARRPPMWSGPGTTRHIIPWTVMTGSNIPPASMSPAPRSSWIGKSCFSVCGMPSTPCRRSRAAGSMLISFLA